MVATCKNIDNSDKYVIDNSDKYVFPRSSPENIYLF